MSHNSDPKHAKHIFKTHFKLQRLCRSLASKTMFYFIESSSMNELILGKDNELFDLLCLVTLLELKLINFIQNIAGMFHFFYHDQLLLTFYEIGNDLSIF